MESMNKNPSSQDVLFQENQINTSDIAGKGSEKIIESVMASINSSLGSTLSEELREMHQQYITAKRRGRENFSITEYINNNYRPHGSKYQEELFLKKFFEMIDATKDAEYIMQNISLDGLGLYPEHFAMWRRRPSIPNFRDDFSRVIQSLFLEFVETDSNANGYYVLKNKEAFKELLKKEAYMRLVRFNDETQKMDHSKISELNTVKILSKLDPQKVDLTDIIRLVDRGALLSEIVAIPGMHQYISDEQKEIIKEYEVKLNEEEQQEKAEYYDKVIKKFKEDFPGLEEMGRKFNHDVIKRVFKSLSQEEQIRVMQLEKDFLLQTLDELFEESKRRLNSNIEQAKRPSDNFVNRLLKKIKIKKRLPKFGKSKKEEEARIATVQRWHKETKNELEHMRDMITARELSFDDFLSRFGFIEVPRNRDEINDMLKK